MNYFEGLSFVFGAVMILTRPVMHLFPKHWNSFELNTAYTEKQPRWVWVVAMLGLLLVGFTWYQHFTAGVPNSLIITIFISLTLIKTSQVLFNYQQFRKFVIYALTVDRSVLNKINIAVLFMGVAVISLGIFVY
ncbi:hypothetical protein [Dethiobacter alkaliphilus]|uniref:hypothetical protein n=1 Tax=Dethiobacter alkaliphilus TaxID=427926 RepID=UPI0022275F9A|nr:hypothetical protein [Dethiobacter alkaliphilus]MCW3491014.1 hypothetical protein [Dethiobacter alkaliphilus]